MYSKQYESDLAVCLFEIDDYVIQTELENIQNANDTIDRTTRYNIMY